MTPARLVWDAVGARGTMWAAPASLSARLRPAYPAGSSTTSCRRTCSAPAARPAGWRRRTARSSRAPPTRRPGRSTRWPRSRLPARWRPCCWRSPSWCRRTTASCARTTGCRREAAQAVAKQRAAQWLPPRGRNPPLSRALVQELLEFTVQHQAQLAGDGELFGYEEGDLLAGGGAISDAASDEEEDAQGACAAGEVPHLTAPPTVV